MLCQDFAKRANAFYTRDDLEQDFCSVHERWHSALVCPDCAYEAKQEQIDRALVERGQA